MPVIETVLIYGVIPLAVFLVFAVLTLLPGRGRDKTNYRPGQPWEHEAVWYEPHPAAGGHGDVEVDHGRPGLGATAAALAIGEHPHEPGSADDLGPRRTAAGGARGTW
ncbi:hypothetical protein SAMN05661080_02182 [Modestobacter sp. DSM 44400]|uniref:aa3-type cytochrome oxidase subunit CtaJ n=1 Tax=Modestobacter sp. DSM 44400 TaxID=1550230 RepID=UPI00089937D2|nr:hypothetical protein [Modestobacter sp. DSM 44400]SDY05785.1 hypothetical protein SAMN05661080_02182 [Modestobacter sp. DSM 44400]